MHKPSESMSQTSLHKIYRPNAWRIVILIIATVLALVFFAMLPRIQGPLVKQVIVVPVLVLSLLILEGLLFLLANMPTCLIISPDGIEYCTLSHTYYASWDKIDRIERIPPGMPYATALVLRESPALIVKREWLLSLLQRGTPKQTDVSAFILMPFEIFGKLDQELVQDIKRYAPHLAAQ